MLRNRETPAGMAVSSWWRLTPRAIDGRYRLRGSAVPGGISDLVQMDRRRLGALDGGRWGFVAAPVMEGPLFDEVVGQHGHRVEGRARGSQNPILYWPR